MPRLLPAPGRPRAWGEFLREADMFLARPGPDHPYSRVSLVGSELSLYGLTSSGLGLRPCSPATLATNAPVTPHHLAGPAWCTSHNSYV